MTIKFHIKNFRTFPYRKSAISQASKTNLSILKLNIKNKSIPTLYRTIFHIPYLNFIHFQSLMIEILIKTGKIFPNYTKVICLHLGRNIIRQLIAFFQALGLNVCPHSYYEGKQIKNFFLHIIYLLNF